MARISAKFVIGQAFYNIGALANGSGNVQTHHKVR